MDPRKLAGIEHRIFHNMTFPEYDIESVNKMSLSDTPVVELLRLFEKVRDAHYDIKTATKENFRDATDALNQVALIGYKNRTYSHLANPDLSLLNEISQTSVRPAYRTLLDIALTLADSVQVAEKTDDAVTDDRINALSAKQGYYMMAMQIIDAMESNRKQEGFNEHVMDVSTRNYYEGYAQAKLEEIAGAFKEIGSEAGGYISPKPYTLHGLFRGEFVWDMTRRAYKGPDPIKNIFAGDEFYDACVAPLIDAMEDLEVAEPVRKESCKKALQEQINEHLCGLTDTDTINYLNNFLYVPSELGSPTTYTHSMPIGEVNFLLTLAKHMPMDDRETGLRAKSIILEAANRIVADEYEPLAILEYVPKSVVQKAAVFSETAGYMPQRLRDVYTSVIGEMAEQTRSDLNKLKSEKTGLF